MYTLIIVNINDRNTIIKFSYTFETNKSINLSKYNLILISLYKINSKFPRYLRKKLTSIETIFSKKNQ